MAAPVVIDISSQQGGAQADFNYLYAVLSTISVGGTLAAANTDYVVKYLPSFQRTTQLFGDLPAINLMSGSTLTFDGYDSSNYPAPSNIIDANGFHGFVVYSGKVTFQNLIIVNAVANGGDGGLGGGGGGAGLGGGLFVGKNADVTLINVDFGSNSAKGGNGGAVDPAGGGGGGGGIGADGGNGNGGGGGGGGFGGRDNGGYTGDGGQGYLTSPPQGGAGGIEATINGQPGGGQGRDLTGGYGGGGAGGGGAGGIGGGGGGVGGANSQFGGANGNTAGFGGDGGNGGGGGGGRSEGGDGGFAGGGGGSGLGSSLPHVGGNGGFGGGGGGSNGTPGTGGFGAGNGSLAGGGGGGAALGGDVFVQQGGKLTVIGGTLMDATETGGTGANGAENGQGHGDIFIQGTMTVVPTTTVHLNRSGGPTETHTALTIGDTIADEKGISGSGTTGKLFVTGGGTLTLTGANTYVGGTQIDFNTTVSISADNNIGKTASKLFLAGGSLLTTGGYTFTHDIEASTIAGTFTVSSGTVLDTGAISGSGIFAISGAGTLALAPGQLSGLGALGLYTGNLSFTTGGSFGGTILVEGNSLLTLASGSTFEETGLVQGSGNFAVTGGTLLLNDVNTYTGDTTIRAATVEVSDLGAAGTGAISFTSGVVGTLKIDDAALTNTGTNSYTFGNTIADFNPGHKIDLTGLQYNTQNPSLNTISYANNKITVSNGTETDVLNVSGLDGGARFQLSADANGGTIVQVVSTRTFNVSNLGEFNAAILQMDATGQNAAPNANYTINITADFALTGNLLAFNLLNGSTVTINGSDGHGGAHTIDGLGAQRGIFVYSGAVNLENLIFENTIATGGSIILSSGNSYNGGGGGAGLGGGLFVSYMGSATLDNVVFHNSAATGGNGGPGGGGRADQPIGFGGGGGMGGSGGNSGGGGIGLGANGGNQYSYANGGGGIVVGAAGGGTGTAGYQHPTASSLHDYDHGGTGGANGGGGGSGGFYGYQSRALGSGGGIGGGGPVAGAASGPAGGYGGGGGEFGNGGFGGGGGYGADGGFGGGGGIGGVGGFGGGNGGTNGNTLPGGGGGLGAGGAIFVEQGGSIIVKDGSLSNDAGFVAVTGGRNGAGATSGSAFGSGIFIQGNNTLNFAPSTGETVTVANDIADQSGSGGSGNNAGAGSLSISGGGTVALGGNNTYAGNTTVSGAGTFVSISANANLGAAASVLKLGDGTGVKFTDGFTLSHKITVTGDPIFNVVAGEVVTITSVIANGTAAGDVEVMGGGRLVLAAQNTYSGGTVIDGAALELAASGAAGTGAVVFKNGSDGKLVLDAAAFSGTSFGNTISGFDGGDAIDFTNIAYNATHTLSYSNGVLLVKNGGGTTLASLNLGFGSGVTANALVVASDSASHLEVKFLTRVVSVTAETTGDLTTLNAGKVVSLTVGFSDIVSVTGAPRLALNDGAFATYTGGNGTDHLTFSYTVATGQNTNDLHIDSVDLNGGAILSDGQPANIAAIATDLNLIVDTAAPTVNSVTMSGAGITAGSGDLNASKAVAITLNMSEIVTLDTSHGAPALTLNDGATAAYSSGSGTDKLTFSYTVAAGENIADLAVTALHLNSATVRDAASNDADLIGAASNSDGTLKIDTTAATVSSVVTSGAGIVAGDGVLNAGKTVTFTVALSEAVVVTGTPQLILDGGAVASYSGGSTTDTLTFVYTVAPGDNVDDLAVTAFDANGGTINDLAGNPSDLSDLVTDPDGTLKIDTTAPTVSSVATSGTGIVAGDGVLNAGQTVTFSVAFSEAVFVNGAPKLLLNDGGVAAYSTGNGTDTLTFSYTVATGENTPDLAVSSVSMNGATVRDAAGNDASLSSASGNPAGALKIDTTAPTVFSVDASGDGIVAGTGILNAGRVVTLTITMNEAVTIDGGVPTLTLNDGGTATYTSGSGTTALTFSYTVLQDENVADLKVDAIDLNGATARDRAGNDADLGGAVANPIGILEIDTTDPVIQSVVASGAGIAAGSGALNAGHTVTFTVNISESVVVDATNGTPTLRLSSGGTATYKAVAAAARSFSPTRSWMETTRTISPSWPSTCMARPSATPQPTTRISRAASPILPARLRSTPSHQQFRPSRYREPASAHPAAR